MPLDDADNPSYHESLSRLRAVRKRLEHLLDASPDKIYGPRELVAFLSEHRAELKLWGVPFEDITTFLENESRLQRHTLKSERYPKVSRFSWGPVSPFQLAASVRKGGYFSHGTAVFLHALTKQLPRTFYLNTEQSPKPPGQPPTQEAIDRAFGNKQRESNYVLSARDWQVVLLSGKFTDNLEVGETVTPDGKPVPATKLERTLIDIVVRPAYAGGVHQVLEAFKTARNQLSLNVLLATLKKLAYVYPYHQSIGFYMTRAGYSRAITDKLKRLGLHFDFYLAHGMTDQLFDSEWRIHFPKGL